MSLRDTFNQYQLGFQRGATITWATDGTLENLISTLTPGETGTVVIRLRPNASGNVRGTGAQGAYLTVTADQEVRSFHIQGFSVAPALEMSYEGENLRTSDRRLFRGDFSCVGNEAIGGALTVTNTNRVPVSITGLDVFASDDEIRQGTSPYPLLTDDFGNPIAMSDYFLSTTPQVAPVQANDLPTLPLTLQPGETRTLYLGFVAQRPGRRFGRVFLRTDAVNFTGKDDDAFLPGVNSQKAPDVEGIFVLDMNASGIGGELSLDPDGNLMNMTVSFPSAKVSATSQSEVMIFNTGDCDLLIRKNGHHADGRRHRGLRDHGDPSEHAGQRAGRLRDPGGGIGQDHRNVHADPFRLAPCDGDAADERLDGDPRGDQRSRYPLPGLLRLRRRLARGACDADHAGGDRIAADEGGGSRIERVDRERADHVGDDRRS